MAKDGRTEEDLSNRKIKKKRASNRSMLVIEPRTKKRRDLGSGVGYGT